MQKAKFVAVPLSMIIESRVILQEKAWKSHVGYLYVDAQTQGRCIACSIILLQADADNVQRGIAASIVWFLGGPPTLHGHDQQDHWIVKFPLFKHTKK